MIDIVALEKERLEWSLKTFLKATASSSLIKLEEEITEIKADIEKGERQPEEYADALMCLFDSAGRNGILPEEIFLAFKYKLAINKRCQWIEKPDGTYDRIKQ